MGVYPLAFKSSNVYRFPLLFDIFSPSTSRCALWNQWAAKPGTPVAHSLWAISFSWCGKHKSMPPPWRSKVTPKCSRDIAEHSICQPGRPSPQGLGQKLAPSSGFLDFHKAKSEADSRSYSSESLASPALFVDWVSRFERSKWLNLP